MEDPFGQGCMVDHTENLIHSWDEVDEDDIPETEDVVNHPSHYRSKNGVESIGFVEEFISELTGWRAFFTGNVLKYMVRWNKKNGVEDLKKAKWYLERLISKIEAEGVDR